MTVLIVFCKYKPVWIFYHAAVPTRLHCHITNYCCCFTWFRWHFIIVFSNYLIVKLHTKLFLTHFILPSDVTLFSISSHQHISGVATCRSLVCIYSMISVKIMHKTKYLFVQTDCHRYLLVSLFMLLSNVKELLQHVFPLWAFGSNCESGRFVYVKKKSRFLTEKRNKTSLQRVSEQGNKNLNTFNFLRQKNIWESAHWTSYWKILGSIPTGVHFFLVS